jgi:hypothetical protein
MLILGTGDTLYFVGLTTTQTLQKKKQKYPPPPHPPHPYTHSYMAIYSVLVSNRFLLYFKVFGINE